MSAARTGRPGINDPADCHFCKRYAIGLGAGSPGGSPRWVCIDCVPHIREIRAVRNFEPYELIALEEAGSKAGELLDGIGKTDLADLTEQQWRDFLKTVIHGFGASLREQVATGSAPF